jgi:hypothetical protein
MVTHGHSTDDELILLFYGELPPGRADRVEEHVTACPSCRAAWADLQETLALVDHAPAPEPDDGFERVMWARVRDALPERRRWSIAQIVPVTAMAAVVVLVVALSGVWRADPEPAPTAADPDIARQERVLATALDDHLEQTELLLVELLNAPAGEDRELTFERRAANELLASGRLYRLTARETGNGRLVEMLDDLEPVLVEVARSPERVARRDWESLRTRIGEQDLLFKVRAASYEMRAPR